MPRHPRNFVPGIPVHLIQRGNNKQACFFTDRDYIIYLDKLRESSAAQGIAIHSYVLMTNHIHLLCTPDHVDSISRMIQSLGRYYVRYINSTYDRTGTLWEGRYKASLVNSEQYLLTVSRYIELNPVRAKMVQRAAEYPWSSYRKNGLGKQIRLVSPHSAYLSLGVNDKERQENYRALFAQQFPDDALEQIRTAANKAWVLGNNDFKRQIEDKLGRSIPPLRRGGDRKSNEFKGL